MWLWGEYIFSMRSSTECADGRSFLLPRTCSRVRGAAQVQSCAAQRPTHTLQTTCEVQCVLRRCRREGGVCTLQHPSFSTRMGRRGAVGCEGVHLEGSSRAKCWRERERAPLSGHTWHTTYNVAAAVVAHQERNVGESGLLHEVMQLVLGNLDRIVVGRIAHIPAK